jgi:hypothetical protein
MPHGRLRCAWIPPPRGARLPRRSTAPGTTAKKKRGQRQRQPLTDHVSSHRAKYSPCLGSARAALPGQDVELVQRRRHRHQRGHREFVPEPVRRGANVVGDRGSGAPAVVAVAVAQVKEHPPERPGLPHLFRGPRRSGGQGIGRLGPVTGGPGASGLGAPVHREGRVVHAGEYAVRKGLGLGARIGCTGRRSTSRHGDLPICRGKRLRTGVDRGYLKATRLDADKRAPEQMLALRSGGTLQ